jgi:hypothetical protein
MTNPDDQERDALGRIRAWASHYKDEARSQQRGAMKLIYEEAEAALAAREEPQEFILPARFSRDDLQSDEAFRAAEEILTGTFGDPSPQEAHTDLYGQIIDAVCDDLGAGDAAREGEAERLRALAHHLHEALAFMRSCELSGESGADHSTVISALEAYEGFEFDSERNAA